MLVCVSNPVGIRIESNCVTVYVGDDSYDRIWEELNQRKALVFLHGAQTPSSTPFPHAFLGIPVVEVRQCNSYRMVLNCAFQVAK